MNYEIRGLIFLALGFLLISCGSDDQNNSYVPKPKGYNRIVLPSHTYQKLDAAYPYTFEYSTSAVILPDTFPQAEKDWIFIYYPRFNANIQLTYKEIRNDPARLKDFINDAYKLASKHQIRASALQEQTIQTNSGRTATLFRLEGDVPTPFQFYTTDSTTHYLRGAIYFPTATKNDSLAPVIDFIQKDALRLLNTLRWK
jgi:gliding motility-associated lipoprotein GldD